MTRLLLHALVLAACSCSFAEAQDLRDDHGPVALQVQEFDGPIAYDISDEPLWADVHSSCVQAQLDAEAMLADVRAAHDAEAQIVLRDRERVGASQ